MIRALVLTTALLFAFAFAFLVLTFQPMLSNLWHGQVTGLIFACFCLSYWLLHRDRSLAAGLVLGLIVPFKFYPALFVLYFIWRRNWRFVAGALASTLAILLVSLLTVGWDGNVAYFGVVVSELGGVEFPLSIMNPFLVFSCMPSRRGTSSPGSTSRCLCG